MDTTTFDLDTWLDLVYADSNDIPDYYEQIEQEDKDNDL